MLIRGVGQVDRMLEMAGLLERFEVVDVRDSETAYRTPSLHRGVGPDPSSARRKLSPAPGSDRFLRAG